MLQTLLARRDVVVGCLCALTLVMATQFDWLGKYGASGQVEVAAVVLYSLSVWLAVRNSIFTWPTGVAATGLYLFLFYDWGLYADAGLQIVYIAFSVAGLRAWWRRGGSEVRPEADRAPIATLGVVVAAVAVGTVAVREYLLLVGGSAPLWDALLTTGSLGALYLLINKYIETWAMWAVLDVAYVALFLSRELYLSAALYAALFAMVLVAARDWRALLRSPRPAQARA